MGVIVDLLTAEVRRAFLAHGPVRPRVPAGGALLWRWFCDLSRERAAGFAGPEPIRRADIAAYAQATGWPIEPRHVSALIAMDAAWLEAAAELRRNLSADMPQVPKASQHVMTPELFDAMFG